MNNIIRKVLEELSKESPRLDYIRGSLETLLEMQESKEGWTISDKMPVTVKIPVEEAKKWVGSTGTGEVPQDEGQILTAQTKARIDRVREMAEKSTEIS